MDRHQPARLPLAHVVAHDGSPAAQVAYEAALALTEEVAVVFRDSPRAPDEAVAVADAPAPVRDAPAPVRDAPAPVPDDAGGSGRVGQPLRRSGGPAALTMDRILRTARELRAPYVTLPASLSPPERVLVSTLDATARMATDTWPAVAVQVLRREVQRGDGVVVVATHGRTSGATLLVATLIALLGGGPLTAVVVGGTGDQRVRAGVRSEDADLGLALRQRYGIPTHYVRLPRHASAPVIERAVGRIDARRVVVGLGQIRPGVSHRDLSREGRRRLLGGPLRVEHLALRSTTADAVIVADSARLRRRPALEGSGGLGTFFSGDLDRLDAVVEDSRQARNQAVASGSR